MIMNQMLIHVSMWFYVILLLDKVKKSDKQQHGKKECNDMKRMKQVYFIA